MEMPDYSKKQIVKRCIALTAGLFIMSIGIAMSKLAELGTTPISCIPATLTYFTSLSIGVWTMIFNALLVFMQFIILRKDFQPFQLLQLIVAFLIGSFTDVSMGILSPLMVVDSYPLQWMYCILAAVILGFGVMLEIRSNVIVAPGEGLVLALCRVTKVPFPRMKVANDVTMVVIAAVLSLAFAGGLYGVREGTIFSAVAIGLIVGFYRDHFGSYVDRLLD